MFLRRTLWSCMVYIMTTFYVAIDAVSNEFKDSTQSDFSMEAGSLSFTLAVLASLAVFLLVVVLLIPICMDCMNSEVSSANHPACGPQHTELEQAPQNFKAPTAPGYSGFAGYSATGQSNIHFNPMNQEPPPPYEASFGNRQ